MESKGIRASLVISSMLVLLVGPGSPLDNACYDECFRSCTGDGASAWICQYSCQALCGGSTSGAQSQVDPECSLPCVASSCAHLQPDMKGTEACVGTCFKKCARQMTP